MALSARLNKLNGEDLSDMVLAKITNVKLAMNIEVNMNELFWEKMASVNWIWLGSQNEELVAEFRGEEVVEVIRAMAPLKASRKDGFPVLFYQKFWLVVRDRVEKFCLEVLNGQCDFEGINGMDIILIPKIVSSKNIGWFRSISLCNVIYKVISNVIVNRFHKVLNGCIDETQRAFVLRRQITNNIFVAYKILHPFRKKGVDWNFLERVMGSLGFCEAWISFVMRCL
ncbi:uncharacterized protein [Gossypium hirsutum]|uniref:Reverse transcriptase n=1 Tax=Gossypium hirsutum TaxID=3635 RepID=A0A1U8LUN7_GOSHI|nr:uncharacterized protein LOC107930094 [Gossypium hirsutum]